MGYEWAKQTGEKVWVINAAHGGSAISTWQEGGSNYKEAVLLFKACLETLRKEIAAGHFTLSHMGYFWCQGCSDYSMTAENYVKNYLAMHENMKRDMAFSEDVTLEFGGIIPVRAGREANLSYREGTYKDTTTADYYQSFKDLRFTGPRVAQYWMANNPELPDIWNVCNIGEDWVTMPNGTDGVKDYFQENYPNGKVDYEPQVAQKSSWYTPTTPAAVHDDIHYNQIGYNEVGRVAARNALIMLGEIEAPNIEPTVEFLTWDGYTTAQKIPAQKEGSSETLVVPMVSPVWKTKEVAYELSGDLTWDYYDLLATNAMATGELTAKGTDLSVKVVGVSTGTQYTWQMNAEGTGLENVTTGGNTPNALTVKKGGATNGVLSNYQAVFTTPVELVHDAPWSIEWKGSGNWTGMLLSKEATSTTSGNQYFFRSKSGSLSLGYYKGSTAQNFFMTPSFDPIAENVYRLENEVTKDAEGNITNMVYLWINEEKVGPVNDGSATNYVSGTDLVFKYIGGATSQYLNNFALEYLQVTVPGNHTHEYNIEKETVAGNCSNSGYVVWACECGDTITVENGILGDHTFNEWSVDNGECHRECSNCEFGEIATSCWVMNEDGTAIVELTNDNQELVPTNGTISNGVLSNYQAALGKPITLAHDVQWKVEFEASGDWSGMILSKTVTSTTNGNQYFFRTTGDQMSLGCYKSSKAQNYWMAPTIVANKDTVYTLENRVTLDADGNYVSNMIYLWINGTEFSIINDGSAANYVSGTDLTFNYIGGKTSQYANNLALKYLVVKLPTHTHNYSIQKEEVAGTCIESGYVIWACECGETSKVSTGEFGDHVYGPWQAVDGVSRRDCVYCDAYETGELLRYRWEMNETGNGFISAEGYTPNQLSLNSGSITDGVFKSVRYVMTNPVSLAHDESWNIEFSASGDWKGMLLSGYPTSTTPGNQYFFRTDADLISLGHYNQSGKAQNHWLSPTIDAEKDTLYRLENRVTVDEVGKYVSNMVYLWIDGTEVGPVNDGTKSNYVSGTDLTFKYIGSNGNQVLTNIALKYLQIDVPHTHNYTIEGETVPGSCSKSGYVVWSCRCGATKNVDNGEFGTHIYGDWYAAEGAFRHDCRDCDAFETVDAINYRWEMNAAGTELVSVTAENLFVNDLKLEAGSIENGVLKGVRYALANQLKLSHDLEWSVEWKGSGNWNGMILSKNKVSNSAQNQYFFRASGGSLSLGYYDDKPTAHNNFMIVPGFDEAKEYTYRLDNRVTVDEDGNYVSNMVYLIVDDIELGATATATSGNYTSGTDLLVNYFGSSGNHLMSNLDLEYLQIWLGGPEEHKHAYAITESDPGNCQTEGKNTYQCACGDSYTASTGILGDHVFGSWSVVDEYRQHTCTLCGETESFLIGVHYDDTVSNNYYTTVSQKSYILCDGVTESEVIINNKDGSRRQVLHVIEVDANNTEVEVLPGYYGIDKDLTNPDNWSARTVEETMDYYRDELGYNMIAGMNTSLSYASDAPFAFMVMNGELLADRGQGFRDGGDSYLAVTKNEDGTANFELRSAKEPLRGDEWQAITCSFGLTVKDGQLVTKTVERGSGADRSMIGVKADGTLVIVQGEGRNAPYSTGLSSYELGETMLSLGCVWALNGDGGGSSQILTKREGEEDYKVRNIPSDGTPRATIMSVLIASKTKADGMFDHVSMLAESEYITPGGKVQVDVKGVDGSGMPADMPEGITYEATGGAFADGVFISDGTIGQQTITAFYKEEKVGSVDVNVVIPTSISFDNAAMAVPYGKNVEIPISAYYDAFAVALSGSDIEFTLSAEIGSIDGLSFIAPAEEDAGEINTANLTATLVHNKELTATIPVYVGKGSEVLYDFEDKDLHGWYRSTAVNYNSTRVGGDTYLVDANSGHVYNGDYAMAVELDYSNALVTGFYLGTLVPGEKVVLENAMTIGMWVYFPDEADSLRIDVQAPIYNSKELAVTTGYLTPAAGVADGGETDIAEVGFVNCYNESGWHYITVDLSSEEFMGLPTLKFYVSMKDGKNGYVYGEQSNINGKYVLYVDDITVDYSQAVDDRESPIFGDMMYQTASMGEAAVLNGNTISSNAVSFSTTVVDNMGKNNHTGIDNNRARVYIDGVDYSERLVCANYPNVHMSLDNVSLPSGVHTVKFVAYDKMGNRSAIVRNIVVGSADSANVRVVPHDPDAERLLNGSLYYIDVVADDPETISSVKATLDLNNISVWQLDHMDVAEGFKATYSLVKDENIATVNITSTGNTSLSGEDQILVSIPVRTWELPPVEPIYGQNGEVWMYDDYKAANEIGPMDLSVEIDAIHVNYKNSDFITYTGNKILVMTEQSGNGYTSSGSAALNYIGNEPWYKDWNGGHDHRPETKQYYDETSTNHVDAIALEDKAATCTESGYSGRTYCEVCHSVVDWGTTLAATGHNYDFVDGVLKCKSCGELFNGIYTDGKAYIDGIVSDVNGWFEDSYFADGVALTGIRKVPSPDNAEKEYYYDFGDNGICRNRMKYTGILQDGDVYRYAYMGELTGGWQSVDGSWYYFSEETLANVSGKHTINGIEFEFEEDGKLVSGVWQGKRYWYGPGYYEEFWYEIDGELYYFAEGYAQTGVHYVRKYGYLERAWAEFDRNGIFVGYLEGFITDDEGHLFYAVEGEYQIGLHKIDGEYYFFNYNTGAVKGEHYAWETHCDLPCSTYEFGDDFKMLNGLEWKDDVLYYYVNGKPGPSGLTKIGDDYYFIGGYGKCSTGEKYAWATNCDLPIGTYTFGADYKMLQGIVKMEDGYYYYVNGNPGPSGLTKVGNDYYFVGGYGKCAVGEKYAWATNCDLPVGTYTFGEDGKMLNPPAAYLRGDVNDDGSVNDDDVILLLWHTLLPDMYPIVGDADFTGDGSINDEDVIYLLWHTLLPDLYPL